MNGSQLSKEYPLLHEKKLKKILFLIMYLGILIKTLAVTTCISEAGNVTYCATLFN